MRLNAMYMQQQKAQQQARSQAGQILYDQMGAQQPAVPPPPPQAAPGPGAVSPGGGNPMAQGGASVMAQGRPMPQMQPGSSVPPPPMLQGGGVPPPPMMQAGAPPAPSQQPGMMRTGQGGIPNLAQQAGGMTRGMPPQIPPFRPMPSAPPAGAQPGQVPPPPAAGPAANDGGVQKPHPMDLKSIVQNLQKSGVKPDQVMTMLDTLAPVMNAQNKQELDFFKANNAALKEANAAYARVMTAMAANKRADTGVDAEARRGRQGDENIQIKRDRESRLRAAAEKTVGGKLTKIEYLYPNGPDGKPDTAQPPTGARGVTSQGKIVNLDAQGNQVAQQSGQPAQKGGGQKDAVRSSIVKSGITNSIARLNEIDKLGDVSTSSFFGQHGSNPLTRGAYGAAKGMQSKGQQDADAKWASMIDEAIPVFTGGLRGSDAFRRFLIEQAPGPGDKPETIREKKRLFRQNIEGTSKAFFNKFSTDPSFWGPGVTKDQLGGGGGDSAPQQGGGEWKVEKVGPGG